jgi:enoyl-CoA hydratase
MIKAMHTALIAFAKEPKIAVVAIVSTRPGVFCAGGDIREIRAARLEGRHDEADAFFAEEFSLNRTIAEYPKPYISLIDGICMGGGLGISIHGAHRVVTENLVLAMPETAIGYFPDIGASYFLNRLPGRVGLYLGLTGARLSAADAVYSGLATAYIPSEALDTLQFALGRSRNGNVSEILADAGTSQPPLPSRLAANRAAIDHCFAADRVSDIIRTLEKEATKFAQETLTLLRAASPVSLRITLTMIQEHRSLPLDACLARELEIAKAVTRSADFAEGVRAALVDKDRKPWWMSPVR